MARVDIIGIKRAIEAVSQEITATIDEHANLVKSTVTSKTPKRSGNARRNWKKTKSDGTGFEVENRVPYIERLEQGHSKQAPRGFVNQTLKATSRRRKR